MQSPKPITGMPVVTPDGFGRVVSYEHTADNYTIKVRLEISGLDRVYPAGSVEWIDYRSVPFPPDPNWPGARKV